MSSHGALSSAVFHFLLTACFPPLDSRQQGQHFALLFPGVWPTIVTSKQPLNTEAVPVPPSEYAGESPMGLDQGAGRGWGCTGRTLFA